MSFDLNHLKHDPSHCLAPGLFRSLKKGDRKRDKLDVTHEYGEGKTVRFMGFEPLGADDMRLLQGLVAMSGADGLLLSPEPKTEIGTQLRLFLEPKFEAVEQDARAVKSTIGKLLKEIGLSNSGENIKTIKDSLIRMSNVGVHVKNGTREASFHLLSYAFDSEDGRLFVALNPLIANAVLGNNKFTYIDMAEVRAISQAPTRLIHQRLCAWINQGGSGKVSINTLCDYVWCSSEGASPATIRQRKTIVRRSLKELESLPAWTVKEYAKDKYEFSRSKHKQTEIDTEIDTGHDDGRQM